MNEYDLEMRNKTEAELNLIIRQVHPSIPLHIAAETELCRRRISSRQWAHGAWYFAVGSFLLAALIYWIKK
jgi:hypothetical protein